MKLRLDDWEEGGYRVNDQPNARGEVIIGSDTVSAGYYLNEEATTEAFFDENGIRWWRSGDIGKREHLLKFCISLFAHFWFPFPKVKSTSLDK